MRKRAALLAPVHNTPAPYNGPELGKKIAYNAHRDGVADRLDAHAVPKTMAVDLALSTYAAQRRSARALFITKPAKQHEAQTLSWLQTVPGMGNILRLGLLYESQQLERVPRGQDVAAYCRRGKCAQASGGQRVGPAGQHIGHAPLTWAFSEAATLCLRRNAPGQNYLARREKTHDTGNALRSLPHPLARAV